jgi:hypothetical protein
MSLDFNLIDNFWEGHELTTKKPVRRKWVSSECWEFPLIKKDLEIAKHEIRGGEILIPYSTMTNAIERLKSQHLVSVRNGGPRFCDAVYEHNLGIQIVYTNKYTFSPQVKALEYIASSESKIRQLTEITGLTI